MHSLNISKYGQKEESLFDSSLPRQNLKIVIENDTTSNSDDQTDVPMLDIESVDMNKKITNKNKSEEVSDISDEEYGLEVEVADNEIEFHVKLDKPPASLVKEKIYLNESLNKPEWNSLSEDMNFISSEDLNSLYKSLDLTDSSFAKDSTNAANSIETVDFLQIKENIFDKKKLHLFGTDELSTAEIFDYFKDYKPVAVEWINDSSCNVLFENTNYAANAIFGMSTEWSREECDDSNQKETTTKDDSELKKSKIISLKSQSRKSLKPPMYPDVKWRQGVKSVKGYQIYMRYMLIRHDHKKKGAESRSEYYRKYGNPNYGNLKGLISHSRRERMKNQYLDDTDLDIKSVNEEVTTSRRHLISYELDDYTQTNIDEFGTNKPSKIENRTRNEKSREKKLRLYSDDLLEKGEGEKQEEEKDFEDPIKNSNKRKIRYTPYEPNSKMRRSDDPEDLRNKLNKLRNNR